MQIYAKAGVVILLTWSLLAGCMNSPESNLSAEKPTEKPPMKATQEVSSDPEAKKENQASASKQDEPNTVENQANPVFQQKPSQQEAINKEQEQMKKQVLFYRGSKHKKRVALTFDDGPDRKHTLHVLQVLKNENVPGTFFVVGNMVQKHPDVLKQIDQEGHVIGNHSWNHPQMTKLSAKAVDAQINRTNQEVYNLIGKKPLLFRPPYGAINKRVENQIGGKGIKVVNWSVDTNDWRGRSSKQILDTVKSEIEPGGIILQHSSGGDKLQGSMEALPEIIKYLKAQGYEFVTIDELIYAPAYKNEG
ncbi:polysaccharide deacetylase family protein [Hazenella coriacea]|uniref:Peptidoglycan/xylan/chitin deacetylase (PgdA/CDA1 family) n=1 Tax=Hazenella coriacea TaxID=1179467 RepID=A0A4R3L9T1_9BACL|nr:polysaccharide deacetylase family protein [Hazenella coriacea]TCS96469.1 peptidoglycan/xylan/chitin deacetylase (PgdA/CDA1 family) [Hazenella coriacea]